MASAPTTPCHLLLQSHDPDPSRRATETPRSPSPLPLTLCSLPRPLLPLPSTPERSSSSPTQITAATVHPVPPRWVQRNSHRLLRRQHQPIRPREPSSVFPELIPNFRPPATSPAIRRRLRLPEPAESSLEIAVSSDTFPPPPQDRFCPLTIPAAVPERRRPPWTLLSQPPCVSA